MLLFAAVANDRRNRKEVAQKKNPQKYSCQHKNIGIDFKRSSQTARKYVYPSNNCLLKGK